MKLIDLIEAFAGEIEQVRPQLDQNLDILAIMDNEHPDFAEVLDQYSGQAQRMGEAAELAGFPGLQLVCVHVVENCLLLLAQAPQERNALIAFLRAWPPLIVYYLRNLSDPSAAAGLIDHLRVAPLAMEEEQALRVMHMLGAMPMQVGMSSEGDVSVHRPVLATPQDVTLVIPDDVDQKFLEGFFQEAPAQVRTLVNLARRMATGESNSQDTIAAKRVAHTLKGSGATIGLRGITALSHHLEDILEHFEVEDAQITQQASNALLDAAFCLEHMVGYVIGSDDYPQQAQAVLQVVLDLANRIDGGESLETPATRVASTMPVAAELPPSIETTETDLHHPPRAPLKTAGAALRVSMQRIEELFLISSEVSVQNAAMEARIKALASHSQELLAQNLRMQKRLFELETVVEVRSPTMLRVRDKHAADAAFDALEMDQYGELHSTFHALAEEAADVRTLALRVEEGIAQVASQQMRQQHLSVNLQHLVISTRMAEVSVLESRLQRTVRATCQATEKEAVLTLEGGETLIDNDLLSRLTEPLLHLLRNAVDHGLETPDERSAAGKPRIGRLLLSFSRHGQQVVLRCQDDGRGLDLQKIKKRALASGLINDASKLSDDDVARLILLPGFSTRDTVSELSGRGIGMDVVHSWVGSMGGSIEINSRQGQDCLIELRFPASLSTVQSLIVEVTGDRFALPSAQVEQVVAPGVGTFEKLAGQLVYRLGKRAHPAVLLADATGLPAESKPLSDYAAVIVQVDRKKQVLAVDRLLDSRELLVNSPGRYARHLRGVAGLSILGDGAIAVNIDLVQLLAEGVRTTTTRSHVRTPIPVREQRGVLIVDDSLSVRNSLLQLVQDAGYRGETARDGIDAINTLRNFKPDVLLTDLEMPNMNGVELIYHIRERTDLKNLPIVMITSRSQDKHRRLAEQAGANTYITKPYNDADLLRTIRSAMIQ